MKSISLTFIVLTCIAAGVLRFYDLSFYTDLQGFSTYLNATVRYIVLLAIVLLAVIHSVIFSGKTMAISGRYFLYSSMLITGVIHIILGVVNILFIIANSSTTIHVVLTAMIFITGFWFTASSLVSFKTNKIFTCGIIIPLVASAYYYVLMINNFITTASSIDRVSTVISVLIPMSVVAFLTSYIKQLYFANRSYVMVQITGLICFLFAGCIGVAELFYGITNGTISMVPLLNYIACVSIGVFSLCATVSLNKKPAKVRQDPVY